MVSELEVTLVRKKEQLLFPVVFLEAQQVTGGSCSPRLDLHFKRLIQRMVIVDVVCLYIGNLLFSKLLRPPPLAAMNLTLSFRLMRVWCSGVSQQFAILASSWSSFFQECFYQSFHVLVLESAWHKVVDMGWTYNDLDPVLVLELKK